MIAQNVTKNKVMCVSLEENKQTQWNKVTKTGYGIGRCIWTLNIVVLVVVVVVWRSVRGLFIRLLACFACVFWMWVFFIRNIISLPNLLLFVIVCVWMPFDSSFSGELPANCVNNRFAIHLNFVYVRCVVVVVVVVRVWFSLVEQQLD